METVLLFFLKHHDKEVDMQYEVSSMIKNVFPAWVSDHDIRVPTNELKPEWKANTVVIDYSIQTIDKMLVLKLSTRKMTVYDIFSMQTIVDKLEKGNHRKDYYITVSYDEPSQHLCQLLYPLFSSFEKKLRRLMYELFIKSDGEKWVEKTINQMPHLSDDMKEKVRGNKEQLIEGAIDEFEYSHYLEFVNGTLYGNLDTLWETEFAEENLMKLSRDQIIEIIERNRPTTLWEIAFRDYEEMQGFSDALKSIQLTRNKVMHSKWLPYDEFLQAKRELRSWSGKIELVINKLEKQVYSGTQKRLFGEYYSSALKEYAENMSRLKTVVDSARNPAFVSSLKSLKDTVSRIMGLISISADESSWLDSFIRKIAFAQDPDEASDISVENSDESVDCDNLKKEDPSSENKKDEGENPPSENQEDK